MNKEDEIVEKIYNIETITNEIYKEVINLKKQYKNKNFEMLKVMSKIEDIEDFIKML